MERIGLAIPKGAFQAQKPLEFCQVRYNPLNKCKRDTFQAQEKQSTSRQQAYAV